MKESHGEEIIPVDEYESEEFESDVEDSDDDYSGSPLLKIISIVSGIIALLLLIGLGIYLLFFNDKESSVQEVDHLNAPSVSVTRTIDVTSTASAPSDDILFTTEPTPTTSIEVTSSETTPQSTETSFGFEKSTEPEISTVAELTPEITSIPQETTSSETTENQISSQNQDFQSGNRQNVTRVPSRSVQKPFEPKPLKTVYQTPDRN